MSLTLFPIAGPGSDERSLGRNECSWGFNRHFGRKWQWLFRISLRLWLHRHDVGKLSVHLQKRQIQLFIQIRWVKLFSLSSIFPWSNDPSGIQTCLDAYLEIGKKLESMEMGLFYCSLLFSHLFLFQSDVEFITKVFPGCFYMVTCIFKKSMQFGFSKKYFMWDKCKHR